MTENELQEILKCKTLEECGEKIKKIYPNGFDMNKEDKRLQEKINSFFSDNKIDINTPIQLREK